MFPPTFVVCGNTQRAADLPEALLFNKEGDINLVKILVDFIKKRFQARKHAAVDVTFGYQQ